MVEEDTLTSISDLHMHSHGRVPPQTYVETCITRTTPSQDKSNFFFKKIESSGFHPCDTGRYLLNFHCSVLWRLRERKILDWECKSQA